MNNPGGEHSGRWTIRGANIPEGEQSGGWTCSWGELSAGWTFRGVHHPGVKRPRSVSNIVQVLQKKTIRAIHMLPYNSYTNDLFKINKFLKLDDIYKLNLCSHIFHYLNINNNITAWFLSLSNIQEHNTRHRHSILIIQYHRSRSQASLIFQFF